MIYGYYRKNLGSYTDRAIQQIYQWADEHELRIDIMLWEEHVTQKTAFENRLFVKDLLPRLKSGDVVIVSELSCLGRSAAELDKLLNHSIKQPIRIACVSIGMDINWGNLTPSDKSTLEKIAFAARLQKLLAHEITESALSAKKRQRKKLGGASEKWKQTYHSKSEEEKKEMGLKMGLRKNQRHLQSPNVLAFLNIFKKVFPHACNDEDAALWDWKQINTKGHNKYDIIYLMQEYKDQDKSGKLFAKWNLEDDTHYLQQRLTAAIQSLSKSLRYNQEHKATDNENDPNDITLVNLKNLFPNKRRKGIRIDKSKMNQIEEDTKKSQEILSAIFSDDSRSYEEVKPDSLSNSVMEIMKILLSRDEWTFEEVEYICKQRNLLLGTALELINDYSYSIIEDTVISVDGNKVHVVTDYKQYLI